MKKKMLLIDYNNLVFRSVFANLDLSYKGKFTGGLYGFFNMVSGVVSRYEIDRIIVCKDTKPYVREKFYPKYKGNRSSLDEEAMKKVASAKSQIDKFIKGFAIPVAQKKGYEADDFIGRFCRGKWRKYAGIYIMSNDSDFNQLLTPPNVFLVKTSGLYGRRDMHHDYPDVQPEEWPLIIALTGSHNGVPGIFRVGEKTAVKLMRQHNGNLLEHVHQKYGEEHDPQQVALRRRLATFPFPLAPRPVLPRVVPIDYCANRFEKTCDKYGIQFKNDFHNAFMRLAK